jgi:hypothetical protein
MCFRLLDRQEAVISHFAFNIDLQCKKLQGEINQIGGPETQGQRALWAKW